jgi:hypothetical protein
MYKFFLGNIVGIYIAQNYNIPDVKKVVINLMDYIKTYEKKD